MKKIILTAGLIAFSQAASAHTGLLPTGGFSHGFQHPFLGMDHFLAMLGLGLWASSQNRALAKQAIGVFLLFMAAGALLGLAGFGFAYVETGILVSLLLVGVALSVDMTSIVPTLQRTLWGINGNSGSNALGNRSCVALPPASLQVVALRRDDAGVIRQAHDRLSDTAFPRWSAHLYTQVSVKHRHSGRDAGIQSQGCERSKTSCASKQYAWIESYRPWRWIPASLPVRRLLDKVVYNNQRWSVGTIVVLTSIAAFASMHGLAHGSEMPVAASAYAYIAGIVSATALLHVTGLALGLLTQRINATGLLRIYGTLTGVIGAWLLFAA